MQEPATESRGAALPTLAEANHEPGGQVIFGVVSFLHAFLKPLVKRDWRAQQKIPSTGGVVLAVNHISNVDPLAVGQYVAFAGRWPRFLAKASILRVPVAGRIIRACGQIPVERDTAAAQDALAEALTAVRADRAVVVYVEGTITSDPDLWPMRGRNGAARIALQTGVPVVPIGQWGAQEIMYGKRIHPPTLLPRRTFRLVTGDPVPLDDLRALPVTTAVLDEATERIMVAITALVAELRQQTPPARPFDPRPRRAAPDQVSP